MKRRLWLVVGISASLIALSWIIGTFAPGAKVHFPFRVYAATLTPKDREPVHLVYERILLTQGQIIQLQGQLSQLQGQYNAAIEKVKAKCGGDVLTDQQTGILQCAPKDAKGKK